MCWVHVCEYTLDGWNGMKWAGIRLLRAKWEPNKREAKENLMRLSSPAQTSLFWRLWFIPLKEAYEPQKPLKPAVSSSFHHGFDYLWLQKGHVMSNQRITPFFYPTVEIVPKKRIGTTVSRGFGTTMAGWWSKNRQKKMRTGVSLWLRKPPFQSMSWLSWLSSLW